MSNRIYISSYRPGYYRDCVRLIVLVALVVRGHCKMSPASQGALEVERYIGSCLISSNVRAGLHGGKSAIVCRKQEQPPATIRGGKARGFTIMEDRVIPGWPISSSSVKCNTAVQAAGRARR